MDDFQQKIQQALLPDSHDVPVFNINPLKYAYVPMPEAITENPCKDLSVGCGDYFDSNAAGQSYWPALYPPAAYTPQSSEQLILDELAALRQALTALTYQQETMLQRIGMLELKLKGTYEIPQHPFWTSL
jgi:hypothetical protein